MTERLEFEMDQRAGTNMGIVVGERRGKMGRAVEGESIFYMYLWPETSFLLL